MNLTKLKDKITLQTVILLVGGILLLAELIVLTVFLVGRIFGGSDTPADAQAKPDREIRVPQIPRAKMNEWDASDFVYDGDYLSCTAQDYALGVDVSHYQGDIDWQQVRQAGFTFAILRVGGRGYGEEGKLYRDTHAQKNYEGAKAAGLKVGVYFFSQAVTEGEAREEARYVLSLIDGWELDLPVVYDWEHMGEDSRTAHIEEDQKILFTQAFFQVIESAGYQPMPYVAPWASEDYMAAFKEYPIWLVLYSDQMTFKYHFDIWQYSCTGKVPGIEGDVDINIAIIPDEA